MIDNDWQRFTESSDPVRAFRRHEARFGIHCNQNCCPASYIL